MPNAVTFDPCPRIAEEASLPLAGVRATAELLAEGASVPFIARYRKEKTGGLDEVQIRTVEEKRAYYIELFERRQTILAEIEKQGKLTDELKARIESCWVKSELEDLYLPYKPKRRTRAMIARERGLEGLAQRILEQPDIADPTAEAAAYVNAEKEVPDAKAALQGARDIVAETIADRADVRGVVRDLYKAEAEIVCEPVADKTQGPTKFEAYYKLREKASTIPSHRFLAVRRGETEGVLRVAMVVEGDDLAAKVVHLGGVRRGTPFAGELETAARDALDRLIAPSIVTDLRVEMKMAADREAAVVFAENLRRLLLAAPLGRRSVLGIDPGQRTGCKCVVVDDTGTLRHHTLINLVAGEEAHARAQKTLIEVLDRHRPYAVAVGNGTHGRETADFCRDLLRELGRDKDVIVVMVNEAGASVYSASDVAREEFPDLDLTVRGAVSIARRLQDPLAELVKIDPKAIGVGQYQHDVFQPLLKRKLDDVVESCVNAVGVELNTASAPLLERVAGVGPGLAKKIVKRREDKGAFSERRDLLEVSGLGPKTFEQCAGFVRIQGGKNPLDASAVHPERYELVERMASDAGLAVGALVGNADAVGALDWKRYLSAEVGQPTLDDIRAELLKPGRDPRAEFDAPQFRDDVRTLEDLKSGMALEGVVTNVTAFGAFVDLGVHQDGLVHISQLADRFVKDPHEVVRVGDKIKVRVLEVDLARKRISLTAKSQPAAGAKPAASGRPSDGRASASGNAAAARPQGRPQGRPNDRPQSRPQAKAPGQPHGQPHGKPQDRAQAKPQSQSQSQQPHSKPQAKPPTKPKDEGFSNRPFARLLGQHPHR
jgi:uncharacterized protein